MRAGKNTLGVATGNLWRHQVSNKQEVDILGRAHVFMRLASSRVAAREFCEAMEKKRSNRELARFRHEVR